VVRPLRTALVGVPIAAVFATGGTAVWALSRQGSPSAALVVRTVEMVAAPHAEQAVPDADVTVSSPMGEEQRAMERLPVQRTLRLPSGSLVWLRVASHSASGGRCWIAVDGQRVSEVDAPGGVATCRARVP